MIRLICGGVLAVSAAYIGLGIKRYYTARESYFERLIELVDALAANVAYLKKPVPAVISEFVCGRKGELIKELNEYAAYIERADYARVEAIKTPLLRPSERLVVIELLKAVGRADSKTELDMLNGYRAKLKSIYEGAKKQRATTGALAFKLSVLLGIVVLILLA